MKEWDTKRHTKEPLTEALNTGIYDNWEEEAREGDEEEVACELVSKYRLYGVWHLQTAASKQSSG